MLKLKWGKKKHFLMQKALRILLTPTRMKDIVQQTQIIFRWLAIIDQRVCTPINLLWNPEFSTLWQFVVLFFFLQSQPLNLGLHVSCVFRFFFYCTSFFCTWFACAHFSNRLQCTKQEFHSLLDHFTILTSTILASQVLFFSLLWECQLVLGYFQSSIILLNCFHNLYPWFDIGLLTHWVVIR